LSGQWRLERPVVNLGIEPELNRKRMPPKVRWNEALRRAPALSVRQPWAWLIVNGYKDVENRSWTTHYRGRS
jgi:hypothetical protein